jgi:hypothetical protein
LIFEPEFLLPVFNSFFFLVAAIIAIIALRSYLLSGSLTVLWLGCGVLILASKPYPSKWSFYGWSIGADEPRGSRPEVLGRGGRIPLRYSTLLSA